MKVVKLLGGLLLIGAIGGAGYFGYKYFNQPTLHSGEMQSIIVPDQGLMYSEVLIDKKVGALLRSNQSNTWEFENGR